MATRAQFYHNAEDPLALACELAARAFTAGRKVALRAPDAAAARRLDQLLWSAEPRAFVPHVTADSPLAPETPVVIGRADAVVDWPHADMLLNLGDDVPPDFERFRLVVEIVGGSEAAKRPARARWKHYRDRGVALQAFDAVRREAM